VATQKAADWLSQQLLGRQGKLEGSEVQLQNMRGVRLDLSGNRQGPKPERRERAGQQLQERADQSRSSEVRERSSLPRGGGR